MTERVKVYEEGGKKAGIPIWAWLLPLLLLLALLAYFLTRHKSDNTAPAATTTAQPAALPTLATIHFATDKADLSPEAKSELDQAANVMNQDHSVHLRLEGYTDSTGTPTHNDNLAGARAAAVAEYLKGKGVSNAQITGEGFGEEKPVASNATSEGKADNRRVELFRVQ